MISRTYIVKMPEEVATNPLDILVETDPGEQDAPVTPAAGGAYYEWRGRPLRLPNPSGSNGFVPRFRLGFLITVTPYSDAVVTSLPGVQLSASLASVSSTDTGPTIGVPAFPDPTGGAAIRLTGVGGAGGTGGAVFMVCLSLPEPKDEDRNPTGQG